MKPYFFALSTIFLVIDQLSKNIRFSEETGTLNTGISLGIFAAVESEIITIILCIVLMLIAHFFKDVWQKSQILAALFFSGAISNVLDRVLYGGVRDWLPIPFTSVYNNLADWYIFIAIVGLLFLSAKPHYDNKSRQSDDRL